MKFIFYIFIFLYSNCSCAQTANFGFSAGLSFSFGNKVNRIGLRSSFFYTYQFVQLNSQINILYNFKTLALNQSTPEIQFGIGSQLGFVKSDTISNNFIGLIDNNMAYQYSMGYTYLYYWDKQQTSQGSGILNLNIKSFTLATQNDLFGWGKGWRDRYRTGAVLIQYRYLDTKIALNTTLWTGDYTGSTKVLNDRNYPARFGYYLDDKGAFTNYSAGLLSLQIEQLLPNIPLQQTARLNIGVDSEYVRHFLQNKWMHDMLFLPKKMIKTKLLHYPMLDSNGNPYLFKENQSVKPSSLYFNLGINEMTFY